MANGGARGQILLDAAPPFCVWRELRENSVCRGFRSPTPNLDPSPQNRQEIVCGTLPVHIPGTTTDIRGKAG